MFNPAFTEVQQVKTPKTDNWSFMFKVCDQMTALNLQIFAWLRDTTESFQLGTGAFKLTLKKNGFK